MTNNQKCALLNIGSTPSYIFSKGVVVKMKTKKTGTDPKLAIIHGDAVHILKKQAQKHHFEPVAQEQSAKYFLQGQDVTEVLPDIDVVSLNDKRKKATQELVEETDLANHRKALTAFLSAPNMFPAPHAGWQVLLLSLLAMFMDLAVQYLSGVPIVLMGQLAAIPDAMRTILGCVHGPDVLKGSGFRLKRPCCLNTVVPLGAVTPSLHPEDYLGGHIRILNQKRFLWLPYRCTAFAVSVNVPRSVTKVIIGHSSLAIPFLCETKSPVPDRPALVLDGQALQSYDSDMLSDLQGRSDLIHAQLAMFSIWLRKKEKRWSRCVQDIEFFRPSVRSGRFVTPVMTVDANLFSAAFAVLKHFLYFAAEVAGWISSDEAQAILLAAWNEVLPESCPSTNGNGMEKSNGTWDTPFIFWDFLGSYLEAGREEISSSGAPCPYGTPAVFHLLPEGCHLVIPRDRLAGEYVDFLSSKGISVPSIKKWEVTLQRTILNWGVPVKTEGDDISWRFSYYDPKTITGKQKSKLPCLAFPTNALPDNLQKWIRNTFGDVFGQINLENSPDVASEVEKEVI